MLAVLRGTSLVVVTVTMGLLAGLFFTFAISVMPGLGRTDARTFIDAMQRINVAILNPWLALSFYGAPVFTLIAAALHLPATARTVLPGSCPRSRCMWRSPSQPGSMSRSTTPLTRPEHQNGSPI
ncbi:MAG: hypothetical protein ACRDRA_18580 [Pseudonocardiaceae bacterium]